MIKEKDVIKVYMPLPEMNSDLARTRHYYICNQNINSSKILFKCQTQKANMITRFGGRKNFNKKFCIIRPSSFVPFIKATVVDKEQVLELLNTKIPLDYLSPQKPHTIPDSVYNTLVGEIKMENFFKINKADFIQLNPLCE